MTTPLVFLSVWHSSSFCVRVFDRRCNQFALYFAAWCVYLTPDRNICVSCLYVLCVRTLVLFSLALCVYLILHFTFCVSCIYVCVCVIMFANTLCCSALCVVCEHATLFLVMCACVLLCLRTPRVAQLCVFTWPATAPSESPCSSLRGIYQTICEMDQRLETICLFDFDWRKDILGQ